MTPLWEELIRLAKSIEPKEGYFGYFDFVDALEAHKASIATFRKLLAGVQPELLDGFADSDQKYGWIIMGAADALDLLPDDPRCFLSPADAEAIPDPKVLAALCSACVLNDVRTVATLAQRVDVNRLDHNNQCPLCYAVGNDHIDCVRVLLDNGANPNQIQNRGNTPLHICASSESSKRILDLLLDAGGDVNIRNEEGNTVLDKLREFGRSAWAAR